MFGFSFFFLKKHKKNIKKKAKNLSHTLEHDVFFLITVCIGRFIRVSQLSYHSYLL